MNNPLIKIMWALAIVAVLSACGGRSADDSELTIDDGSVDLTGLNIVDQDEDLLSRTTLYFDYDSSQLVGDAMLIIDAHARYILDNPGVRITLEGHADERGTREYNLALGEARALSTAVHFQALRVAGDRIDSISYGEERPAKQGGGESVWRLNRRVEILYSY